MALHSFKSGKKPGFLLSVSYWLNSEWKVPFFSPLIIEFFITALHII